MTQNTSKNNRELFPVYNESSDINEKHFTPTNRKWSNSVYFFNKNNIKNTYIRNSITDRVLKSYFKLTPKPLVSVKSKRMRNLVRKSTTKQLFVSKPFIKQTNTKSVITAFLYDRQEKKYTKNLFFIKNTLFNLLQYRYRNINNIGLSSYLNEHKSSFKVHNSKNSAINKKLYKLSRRQNNITNKEFILNKHKIRSKLIKSISSYNVNFVKYNSMVLSIVERKKTQVRLMFYYYFFKWALSLIKLSVTILNKGDNIIYNKSQSYVLSNKYFVIYKTTKNNKLLYNYSKNNSKSLLLNGRYVKLFKLSNKFNATFESIKVMNNIMYKYIHLYFINTYKINTKVKQNIYILYLFYYGLFYKNFIRKFLIKQYAAIFNIYKLYINNIKLNNLLPGLKLILSNIYNSNIELNLIKLKYLHLNSDIFTESLSIKLRKRTSRLLRILRKSLKLVKVPKKIHVDNITELPHQLHSVKQLYFNNILKGLKVNDYTKINNYYKDKISSTLSNMYTNKDFLNNKDSLNIDIFNNLKYKWVTGVRLEASGRLTRRFTAERSVSKFKYKGSLKNLDAMNIPMINSNNESGSIKTPSIQILRNQLKPNVQYTLNSSKRRIGAFGIKGWISSN